MRARVAPRCTLATSLIDRDGNTVESAEASRDVGAGEEYEFVQQVKVNHAAPLVGCRSVYVLMRSAVRTRSRRGG